MKNVKINKKKLGLLGTIILVDSLLLGTFILGGHTPGVLDNTSKHLINEKHEIRETVDTNSFYLDKRDSNMINRTIYYGKPYQYEDKILREVYTIYENDSLKKHKDIKIIPCDSLDEQEYFETITYSEDFNDIIVTKQTINSEVLDDIVLLGLMGFTSTTLYSVGKSIIDREEEKVFIKE